MRLPLLLLALACTPDAEEDSKGTLGADTGDLGCEGTAPDITNITVEEGDPIAAEDGSRQPTVKITVEFEDLDGDAHVVSARLWWDTTIDGSIAAGATANAELEDYAMRNGGSPVDECQGGGGGLEISVGVTGSDLQFTTQYDFGATIIDANGYESEMAVATGTTPAPLE